MAKSKKRRRSRYDEGVELKNSSGGQTYSYLEDEVPMPEGVTHYQALNEVPNEIKNYWRQRFNIFSRYNAGIWMTDDLWYGATQECIAQKIAEHVSSATPPERKVVIDAMTGAGGNAIAFAQDRKWTRVYAMEMSEKNLACARRNAEIYDVQHSVTWFGGDCFEILTQHGLEELAKNFGVIFCSPPWGGPQYRSDAVFDLDTMQPYSVKEMYSAFKKYTDYIVLYLPRTSDLRQIAELVSEGEKAQVVHYCADGRSKALCAYLGPFGQISV